MRFKALFPLTVSLNGFGVRFGDGIIVLSIVLLVGVFDMRKHIPTSIKMVISTYAEQGIVSW